MTYPDIETDDSGYTAAIRYDIGGAAQPFIVLPGCHDTFASARDRARRVVEAVRSSGETGVSAWVWFSGDRPEGFPRTGVKV